MGKYEPLTQFLKDFGLDAWDAKFTEIEEVLGFTLPPSARKHPSWWANSSRGNHSQARGWIDAGWGVDPRRSKLREGHVRFERSSRAGRVEASLDREKLRKQAMDISGLTDPQALEQAAFAALIEREAGRILIELGGTMPDLVVPERERPTW